MVATNVAIEHVHDDYLQAAQQITGPEPGKTVVPPDVIRKAVGPDLDSWILAALAEKDSFLTREAVQPATPEEIKRYGKRPLPMLNVWTRTDQDFRKCRSCIAGNFQFLDPAAQRWTAQAESFQHFCVSKIGCDAQVGHQQGGCERSFSQCSASSR